MAGRLHPAIAAMPAAWLRAHAPTALRAGLSPEYLPGRAGVSIAEQRALLEAVAVAGGDEALVGLMSWVRARGALPREAVLYVLLNSSSVADLIDKEQRLNRFMHSHHRVRVHELREGDGGALELEHYGRLSGPPGRVESLFVLGIHVVLLDEIGVSGLRVTLPNSVEPSRPIVVDGRTQGPVPAGGHER